MGRRTKRNVASSQSSRQQRIALIQELHGRFLAEFREKTREERKLDYEDMKEQLKQCLEDGATAWEEGEIHSLMCDFGDKLAEAVSRSLPTVQSLDSFHRWLRCTSALLSHISRELQLLCAAHLPTNCSLEQAFTEALQREISRKCAESHPVFASVFLPDFTDVSGMSLDQVLRFIGEEEDEFRTEVSRFRKTLEQARMLDIPLKPTISEAWLTRLLARCPLSQ